MSMKKIMLMAESPTVQAPPPTTWASQDDLAKSNIYWGITDAGQNIFINKMVYSGSRLVAIGNNYYDTNLFCATSDDGGLTWTKNSGLFNLFPAGAADFICLTLSYGNGVYIATFVEPSNINRQVYCATSTNGITWTRNSSFESLVGSDAPYAMVYGASKFVATCQGGTTKVLVSSNGTSWSTAGGNAFSVMNGADISSLTWDGSKFIGSNGSNIATSADGITWTLQADLTTISAWANQGNAVSPYISILSNGTRYVVIGSHGGLLYSTNLTNWTYVDLSGTGWGNGQGYAFGWNGTRFLASNGDGIITSTDGISWAYNTSFSTTFPTEFVSDMATIGSNFVIGASSSIITYSSTGTSWTYVDGLAGKLNSWGQDYTDMGLAMVDNGSILVAVGSDRNCATTSIGNSWTIQNGIKTVGISGINLNSVLWHGGKFISYGTGARGFTSTNGVSWTAQNSLSSLWGSVDVNSMATNGTTIVAVGSSGKVATSSDGITWTNQTSLSSTAFGTTNCLSVCYGGGKFVIGGDNGKIATSSDGITWTNQTSLSLSSWGSATPVNDIAWSGSKYVAVGNSAKSATSTDGITWTYQNGLAAAGITEVCASIVWNGSMFMVTGTSSSTGPQAAYSYDGITWINVSNGLKSLWGTFDNGQAVSGKCVYWFNNRFIFLGNNSKVATFS